VHLPRKITWVFCIIFALPLLAAKPSENICSGTVSSLATDAREPGRVFANGIKVTGDSIYPLQTVLRHLGMANEDVSQLREKDVLLVAEGFSGLLPHLLANGCSRVEAVDVWYHQENIPTEGDGVRMREYIQKFGKNLVRGDALSLPFASESKDFVVSHLLVHHLPATYQAATMEMLRVLRRGGTARIFGYIELPGYFIADLRSQGYVVNTSSSVVKLHPGGKTLFWPLSLLVVNKI